MKEFSYQIIKNDPKDLIKFSMEFFKARVEEKTNPKPKASKHSLPARLRAEQALDLKEEKIEAKRNEERRTHDNVNIIEDTYEVEEKI